ARGGRRPRRAAGRAAGRGGPGRGGRCRRRGGRGGGRGRDLRRGRRGGGPGLMTTEPESKRPRSTALYDRAQRLFPGGVNSPVRAYKAVGGTPVFIQRGIGPYVYDVDGNRYVDFVGSWGPLILGHSDPDVVAAIVHTAASGTTFGAPTAREV